MHPRDRLRFPTNEPRSAVPEHVRGVLRQLRRGLLAVAGVLGERAIEHILKAGRQLRVERHESARGVVDVGPELLEVTFAVNTTLPVSIWNRMQASE